MLTTTAITPEEIQALDLYLMTASKIKYIGLAALTLYTWDLILTFPHEVRLWNTRWTIAKTLFFVNRYFALGTAILMTFCSANAFFGVIALLLVANIQMILQHRVYALYGYDKRIVVPVSALFIATFVIMMVMAVIVYLYEKDHEAQIFGACCILGSVDWLYLFWVPMMGLDFVLVVLAGYKSLQHYFQVPDKTWSGARLMRTFARDSILYFFCNFLIYLFSTLLGKFGPSEYYQLGAITITVIPPISANRLLINMYDSAHVEQPTWTMVSKTKASLQLVRDTLRIHHEDMELAFMSKKNSRWMDDEPSFD
ncbi:hypothetical protein DEU56DRAFT_912311 [Suillus clintonianus]|uniref:uncharacterized protein n=1 Tax=Suillus clintonianus TaxID=1904413 RepID=UPI001B87EA2F|nr:uncharacterized protein DEU56DRAFT_912311 [Suillus clintonianus]KAG2139057.1 hypothetical protein DEU56DRAFT_912311 [Suillus clintonianus]